MDATTGAQVAMPAQDLPQRPLFVFSGRLGEMFKIHIVNIALTIVTLGVYRFWAKTRMRKYLWSHIEVAGDGLEYTGTGKELFLGFLIVFGAILLPFFILPGAVLPFVGTEYLWLRPTVSSLQGLLIALLFPVAIYRARRYRLSRTRWRGVRGGLGGAASQFAGKYIFYNFVQIATFGLTAPIFRAKLAHYVIGNTLIGTMPLTFTATPGFMYRQLLKAVAWFFSIAIFLIGAIFLVLLLGAFVSEGTLVSPALADPKSPIMKVVGATLAIGSIVALAVSFFIATSWYGAAETIYFTRETSVAGLKFTLATTPWRYLWLSMSNLVIFLLTLGLATPWIYLRTIGFFCSRLLVEGEIALIILRQSVDTGPRQGEGLADAFDPAGF